MTRRRSNPQSRRGFTLIEMLAVVVLLGLISSVAVVSLARADDAGAFQSARWGFANLNAQTRLAAQSEGCAMVIRSADDGARLAADAVPTSREGWSASFELPCATTIRLYEARGSGGRFLDGLFIDRTGRSLDAMVQIAGESGRSERWFIHGLTGQLTRLDSGGGDE